MFLIRQIAQIIRGDAGIFQILSACLLGALLGAIPVPQALGSIVILVVFLLILNANLFLTSTVFLISKLLFYSFLQTWFDIGRSLVDGPLSEIVRQTANAPVGAWLGFEYYAVVGAIPYAIVLGFILGIAVYFGLQRFRSYMVKKEPEEDEKIPKWKKVVIWLFFGSKTKKYSYSDLLSKRKWRPIRWTGVVVIILFGTAVFLFARYNQPLLTKLLHDGIEYVNQATVDLDTLEWRAGENQMILAGLEVTDPYDTEENLVNLGEIRADLSTADLLRKRIVVERVLISGVGVGVERAYPGEYWGEPLPKVELSTESIEEWMGQLEVWIKDIEAWKSRLEIAKRWYQRYQYVQQRLAQFDPREQVKKQVDQAAKDESLTSVFAEHLLEPHPEFALEELEIEGIQLAGLPHELFRLQLSGISDNPFQWKNIPKLRISNEPEDIIVSLSLGEISKLDEPNQIQLIRDFIPVEDILALLKDPNVFPIKSGFIDLSLEGSFKSNFIDLPINFNLYNALVSIPEVGELEISELLAPGLLNLKGSTSGLKMVVNQQAIQSLMGDLTEQALAKVATNATQEFVDDEVLGILQELFAGTEIEKFIGNSTAEEPTGEAYADDGFWEFPNVLTGFKISLGHDEYVFENAHSGYYAYDREREPFVYELRQSEDEAMVVIRSERWTNTYTFSKVIIDPKVTITEEENGDTWSYEAEYFGEGKKIVLLGM